MAKNVNNDHFEEIRLLFISNNYQNQLKRLDSVVMGFSDNRFLLITVAGEAVLP